jgi:hypothetical protein
VVRSSSDTPTYRSFVGWGSSKPVTGVAPPRSRAGPNPKEKLEVGAEWGDIRDEAADMALAVTGGQSFQYVN